MGNTLYNLPVPLNYKCTDEGVFIYSNTEYDYVRICQAVSINTIGFDDETNTQYAELAGYYQQVQDALVGTGAGNSAAEIEDFTAGEIVPGERRSVREALETKGRTKGTSGKEDRKREEQLPVPEQQAKRNRRRAR